MTNKITFNAVDTNGECVETQHFTFDTIQPLTVTGNQPMLERMCVDYAQSIGLQCCSATIIAINGFDIFGKCVDGEQENITSKTETVIQYAALAKRKDGSWFKLHSFTLKSKESAWRCIKEHKHRFDAHNYHHEYKIVHRTVTYITGNWEEA